MNEKFDEHGFVRHEWLLENMPGYAELGPCCQNLHQLFPGQHFRCEDLVTEITVTPPLIPRMDFEVKQPRHFFGIPPGGGGGGCCAEAPPPVSVPAPATGLLLLCAFVATLLLRRARG